MPWFSYRYCNRTTDWASIPEAERRKQRASWERMRAAADRRVGR